MRVQELEAQEGGRDSLSEEYKDILGMGETRPSTPHLLLRTCALPPPFSLSLSLCSYLNVRGDDDDDDDDNDDDNNGNSGNAARAQGRKGASDVGETSFTFVVSRNDRPYMQPTVRASGDTGTYASPTVPGSGQEDRTYLEPTVPTPHMTAVNPTYALATDDSSGGGSSRSNGRTYLEPVVQAREDPAYSNAALPGSTYVGVPQRDDSGEPDYDRATLEANASTGVYSRPHGQAGSVVPRARDGGTGYAELGADHVQYETNADISAQMKNLLIRQGYLPDDEAANEGAGGRGGPGGIDDDGDDDDEPDNSAGSYEYARPTHARTGGGDGDYQETDVGPVYAEANAGRGVAYSEVDRQHRPGGTAVNATYESVPRQRARQNQNQSGVSQDEDDFHFV